ncbi:MAG: hypothetical protein Q8P23_01225 [bacterium]|nr:hypothetical protein [bacterium]
MSKSKIGLTQANPGTLIYYSLNHLTRSARESGVDFNEWGVCECGNLYWVGRQVLVEGKNTLQLSLLEILNRRDERYSEWGDEEILLFVGMDGQSGEFKWFLLNKEESKSAMSQYNDCSPVFN